MIEGWHDDQYVILFDEGNVAEMTRRYELALYLHGFEVVGLRGWDDFIVRDHVGELFTVPTVPVDQKYMARLPGTIDVLRFKGDDRFTGKIKWYVKPIVFGGDPKSPDNIVWVSLDQHVEAVKWWNQMYRKVSQ